MNVDSIRAYCLSFPKATEKLQWGDALCFKCAPETFAELIEREDIRPAPYVGRYKWVLLERLDAVHDSELEDLIRQSYEMVSTKAPKTRTRQKTKSARKRPARTGMGTRQKTKSR